MHARQTSFRLAPLAAVAIGLLALPACSLRTSPDVTGSINAFDTSARHPIVLSEAPRSLELYPGAGGALDRRQADDLAAFVADYRANGRSVVVLEAPGHGAGAIRAELARLGVPAAAIRSRSYHAPHYAVAAPVRLSYARLTARVPHECGRWPEDLGMSNAGFNARNEPYWNLGCASQANLAAQVADPLDLVRARTETRADTVRRTNVIGKLREGADPSTAYRTDASRINRSVGN